MERLGTEAQFILSLKGTAGIDGTTELSYGKEILGQSAYEELMETELTELMETELMVRVHMSYGKSQFLFSGN